LQRLAGLGAGIVELASLADNNRAGTDDQDGFDVGSFWHRLRFAVLTSSFRAAAAAGPKPSKLTASCFRRPLRCGAPSRNDPETGHKKRARVARVLEPRWRDMPRAGASLDQNQGGGKGRQLPYSQLSQGTGVGCGTAVRPCPARNNRKY